jgi:hypothetical protein
MLQRILQFNKNRINLLSFQLSAYQSSHAIDANKQHRPSKVRVSSTLRCWFRRRPASSTENLQTAPKPNLINYYSN